MPVNRRTFLSQSALLSSSMLLPATASSNITDGRVFKIPADFSIIYLASKWGIRGSWDEFCINAKQAGYNGLEVGLPRQKNEQEELRIALEKHQMKIALQVSAADSNFEKHFQQFKREVEIAADFKPIFINCHSGRDYFTFDQNKQLIEFTASYTKTTGIPIYHETHRSRMLFAAHITEAFLQQFPDLRLTLDISHWCCVHGSLLKDQPEAVDLALRNTDNIHARIGYSNGPQITDPRAPEWKDEVAAHFKWWDKVVEYKIKAGQALYVKPEFGPPSYMVTQPYTRQPIVDLWEVNTHILRMWKERYI